jgi:hypothetical protein
MVFFFFHFLHNRRVNVFLTDDNISFIFIMFYLLAKNNYPCTHLNRATNFDLNYICVCTSGYTDIHCTDDIDECQSSPFFSNKQWKNNITYLITKHLVGNDMN